MPKLATPTSRSTPSSTERRSRGARTTASPLQNQAAKSQLPSRSTYAGLMLQRKCACGSPTPSLTGVCAQCTSKKHLHTNLSIGASNEPLELEADRVADQVLAGPANPAVRGAPPRIQRFTGLSIRQGDTAPASVDQVLASPGRPLESALRQDMEERFGHDFSRVRVHSGEAAEQSARDVKAHAYTVGHNIVFGANRFVPETRAGRRLVAHELTHVVQQSGQGTVVQREVERRLDPADATLVGTGVSPPGEVLAAIETLGAGHVAVAKQYSTELANLARLSELAFRRFNAGAPGKGGPTNAFVYTCHCGWIDMGHFFSSAVAAYSAGYLQQFELRVDGERRTINDALSFLLDKARPVLEPVLATVPGDQSEALIEHVRRLLESGEPRDTALALGYGVEFLQQAAKLVADKYEFPPDALIGEQRSAFTIEDLSSDCYGAALGQDLWERVRSRPKGQDISPVRELMGAFLKDCGAVDASGQTLCEMMNETTPGSCTRQGDEAVWSKSGGTPLQDLNEEAPNLLASAKPLCPDASPKACRSGTGPSPTPLPKALLGVSNTGATLTLPEDIRLHQFRERPYFAGGVSIPGRPERFDAQAPLTLSGPSFVRVTPKVNFVAYSTLGGVPGLGALKSAAHLDPDIGRYGAHGGLGLRGSFDVQARGALQFHVHGTVYIDLGALLSGLAGPEVEDLKEVFKSEAFTKLAQQVLSGDLSPKAMMREVKALLKQKFPQDFKGVVRTVIYRLENMEALALATRLEAQGAVSVGSIPISGFVVHKKFGLSPLLGLEGGVVLSELAKGRTIVGAKGWLYGQDILQAQVTAGIDPIGRSAIAELQAVNRTLTGNKLSLDLRYELNTGGEQQFLVLVGGQFNAFGSK